MAIGVLTPFGLFWLGPAGFTTTPGAVYSGPLADLGPVPMFDLASTATFPSGSYYWFVLVHDAVSGAVRADSVQTIVP